MARHFTTRFTQLLGIRHPVMQEGLGPYKTVALAAAVSNAGGLGTAFVLGPSVTEAVSCPVILAGGVRDGDMEGGILPCGQVAGALTELIDVANFIPAIVEEAVAVLDRLRGYTVEYFPKRR